MKSKSNISHAIAHLLLIISVALTLVILIDKTRDTPNYLPSRVVAKAIGKLKGAHEKQTYNISSTYALTKKLSSNKNI